MVIQDAGRNHEDFKSLLVLHFASMGSWTPSYSADHYYNKMPEITAYKEESFGSQFWEFWCCCLSACENATHHGKQHQAWP